jgi:protein SCO1
MNYFWLGKTKGHPLFVHTAIIVAVGLCFAPPTFAHKGHKRLSAGPDSASPGKSIINADDSGKSVHGRQAKLPERGIVGIEEKPGALIPLDLRFANQKGDSVTLRECVRGPTLFTLLYFGCSDACGLLLSGIANVLRPYADNPQTAPNVIVLSISEKEGPSDAAKAQAIADAVMQKTYPIDRWHFLTGSAEAIRKVTEVAGFRFTKRGDDYDHPLCLMVLSPQGKVTRYIIGTDFLSADIIISLMEANKGTIQPTIARILRSCFSYDPKGRRLVFKTLQVSATVILSLLGIFIFFLVFKAQTRRKKGPVP